jgi:hypothetical protein
VKTEEAVSKSGRKRPSAASCLRDYGMATTITFWWACVMDLVKKVWLSSTQELVR